MDAAEIDGEAGQFLLWLRAFDGSRQFPDADGAVVVYAGRLGSLQISIAAFVEPLSRYGFIAESDSAYGARRVAILAGFAARRIGAEQAPGRLFLEVHSFVHSVSVRRFSGDKSRNNLVLQILIIEFRHFSLFLRIKTFFQNGI